MQPLLAVTIGGLFAAALYLLMRRNIVKLIIGLGLLTHAANLLIFQAGGAGRDNPPILREGADRQRMANPLPQALILTAIVIGFATQAFALVLVQRAVQSLGTEDLDEMKSTEQ